MGEPYAWLTYPDGQKYRLSREDVERLNNSYPGVKTDDGWQIVTENGEPADIIITGNPGDNIPLHETLAAVAQWVDYEADVVETAAEEIDDKSIANAAEDQAEAMHEAADRLDDAAEDAADTAAEVFVETGVPSDEQTAEVVAGNPTEYDVLPSEYYVVNTQTGEVLFGPDSLDRTNRHMIELGQTYPKDEFGGVPLGIIYGNPSDHPLAEVSEVTEDIVTDITPDFVKESVAESAAEDVAPEPDSWLFRKRFGR